MEIGKLRFSRNIESLVDLDSKELRIGNFVYSLNDDSVTAEVVIVNQLMGDEIYYKECDFDGNIGLSAYGIPLTEEWLFKFGFEDSKYDWDKGNWKKDKFSIYKSQGENIYWRQIWTYNPHMEDSDWVILDDEIEIKYVHQIQNYYFVVTGEELTVNN